MLKKLYKAIGSNFVVLSAKIAIRTHQPQNEPSGELRTDKVAKSDQVVCRDPSASESCVALYFQGKCRAKK